MRLIDWLKRKVREYKEAKPVSKEDLTKPRLTPFEIQWRLRQAKQRPPPKPKSKFFKPRPALEKRQWKENEKPD